ncbi:hypothetical protein KVT40_007467 [Elsinoe batatas]|uniref:Opsin-1 n=1 Tax=Elsinoe batatas TaxID=2601811 RepID=A0A8K0KYU1_9PEZI|nr:hypothetical protein KVT40_007467 [Elsinoe batatas]
MPQSSINANAGTNGGAADVQIGPVGSSWYFAICALMGAATVVFVVLSRTKPRQERIFHYITAAVTMVACIAYYSMGASLGRVPINIEFQRDSLPGTTREIFYVRYIDWVITTPLLLLDLLLTAALPTPTILYVILVDEVMIVTGLVGALTASSYKWGYFAFGCAALFYVLYALVWEGRNHANAMGKDVGRTFLICGALTSFLWTLYPIAWGLSEGGNVINANSEAFFYGVLDFLAKPVFGGLLIWGHRNIDPARLGLHIHDYSEKDAFIKNPKEETGSNFAPNSGNAGGVTNANANQTV